MTESDWKAFRKIVPELRERYLEKRNAELKRLLEASDQSPTERFWNVHEKINQEAKILRRCLDDHRRSRMEMIVDDMLHFGLMKVEDLAVFSDDLQARARTWYRER